ncbi:MAG: YitT family protein [Clostridiales Family XIII bacterium]|jgi:uncharacterized membrane-anchored protein YitT (DUF2179 family)|nr:YitT family protein [Clostridiales Family XIII bacterium]
MEDLKTKLKRVITFDQDRKRRWKHRLRTAGLDAVFLIIGCSFGAFGTMGILIPNGLTSGGVTGITRIVQSVFPGAGFSVVYYGAVIVIWVACLLALGFREARKTALLTVVYPLFLIVFERLDLEMLDSKDIILGVLYCGVLYGVCNGLVFFRGYSFGGTDTIAKILRRKLFPHISLSKLLLAIDVVIILASAFIFGRNFALYAIVMMFITSRVTEYIMFGFENKFVQMEIISRYATDISAFIMEDIERGVTSTVVRGEYSGKEWRKMVTLCSPRESMLIKSYIASTDPDALVSVVHIDSVWGRGEGFRDLDGED